MFCIVLVSKHFLFTDISKAYIKCPGNGVLEFVLPPGQGQMMVKIPRPESNVDFDR